MQCHDVEVLAACDDEHCATCADQKTCTHCQPGWELHGKKCKEIHCDSISNCDVCETESTCHTCVANYTGVHCAQCNTNAGYQWDADLKKCIKKICAEEIPNCSVCNAAVDTCLT